MLTNFAKKLKVIPSYFYRNYAAPRLYGIRDRKILSRNLELKNKYAGNRCFILGSGPSLADVDLSILNKEFTFVVNEFDKNKQYTSLSPTFHLIIESNYFTDNGPEYWRNNFKEKDRRIPTKTTMITHLKARPYVNKYGLFKQHQVYYVGTCGIFSNNFPFNLELNRYVPNPKNSILMCMIAAVWMGFNEIYLLGCEHSFLAKPSGKRGSFGYSHIYENELPDLDNASHETMRKYLTPKVMKSNYETNIADILQLFRNYRMFYAKAQKINPELKIYNATPNSFLDVFPVKKFEEINL